MQTLRKRLAASLAGLLLSLGVLAPSEAAPVVTNLLAAQNGTSNITVTGVNAIPGDIIVIGGGSGGNRVITTITDTGAGGSNTYTCQGAVANGSERAQFCYTVVTNALSSGTITIPWNVLTSTHGVLVQQVTGVSSATFGAFSSATGIDSDPTVGTAAFPSPDAIVFSMFWIGLAVSDTFTTDSNWSTPYVVSRAGGFRASQAYRVVSSTTPISRAEHDNTSARSWIGVTASFTFSTGSTPTCRRSMTGVGC